MIGNFFIALLVLVLSNLSVAAGEGYNCDCNEIVGTCGVSMSLKPVQQAQGVFGAELKFQSSSPVCSKIEYYYEEAPYFTILTGGNSGTDELWGQKPINRNNITNLSCKVCKRVGGGGPSQEEKKEAIATPGVIFGDWKGSGNNSFGHAQFWTLRFSEASPSAARVTGSVSAGASPVIFEAIGSIQENSVSWQGSANCTATLVSSTSLKLVCKNFFSSAQVDMQRQ